MRRFEFSDSTSNKFWEIDVKGKTMNVTFGKIGTNGQSKPKDFATPEKAKAEMEKLIKEKTGKGYVEVGGKAIKAAKPLAAKKSSAGSMGKELSKAEKKAKAKKVLAMFAGGQWELARGILEAAQEEHWLFEELLEGCKIEDGLLMPSAVIKKVFGAGNDDDDYDLRYSDINPYDDDVINKKLAHGKVKLLMFEVLLHLPNDCKNLEKIQKLREILGIAKRARRLANLWKAVESGHQFEGLMYDPRDFGESWYEERTVEIAKAEKEGGARSKALKKQWKEEGNLGQGVSFEMVLIPAGEFKMGSSKDYAYHMKRNFFCGNGDETQHEVTLTKPFYMCKYAVTQKQWKVLMANNPSERKGAKLPVMDVSWNDCQAFIKKLNTKTNGNYRLPTEAEWEYACRAGTTTSYSFGDRIMPWDANYLGSNNCEPVAVGSYKPNAFGLYDMHGNVSEWCKDWYGDYPAVAVTDPKGPATGKYRVLRGGSVNDEGWDTRSAVRGNCMPTDRCLEYGIRFGFRLARTI